VHSERVQARPGCLARLQHAPFRKRPEQALGPGGVDGAYPGRTDAGAKLPRRSQAAEDPANRMDYRRGLAANRGAHRAEWLLNINGATLRWLLNEYQESSGVILPTAGTVLDMGYPQDHRGGDVAWEIVNGLPTRMHGQRRTVTMP